MHTHTTIDALASEGLNGHWLDNMATRADHRQAQAEAMHEATDWQAVIDAMPLDDSPLDLSAANDLADVAIEAEGEAERERLAGSIGSACKFLDRVTTAIEESGVPKTIGEDRVHPLDAEDHSDLVTGDAWVDFTGPDRLSRPTMDWVHRDSVARQAIVTDVEIDRASNGSLFARVTFDTARATGVKVNAWNDAMETVGIGPSVLHFRRENGHINIVGACPVKEGEPMEDRADWWYLTRGGDYDDLLVKDVDGEWSVQPFADGKPGPYKYPCTDQTVARAVGKGWQLADSGTE